MTNRPILTIAVPTYNGSKTIGNLLDILVPQLDNRTELIISDNCSTDETPYIVKEYKRDYPKIKYVRNKKNIYADGNFLQCMRLATGEYTMLISDDDILIEGALEKILLFLENNNVMLAYLETVGFHDRYEGVENCEVFRKHSIPVNKSLITKDKRIFFSYVDRQWGFTSSFLWKTDRFRLIKNPERFFNTFWLQSYIHIECSKEKSDNLGIISGPCIAAGAYGIIPNFNSTEVEVIEYKKMLDYAIKIAGYDEKQLIDEWLWKVCFVTSRAVIKEKTIGKRLTDTKKLIEILWRYPYVWIHLFPFVFIPRPICKVILWVHRKLGHRSVEAYVNRLTSDA